MKFELRRCAIPGCEKRAAPGKHLCTAHSSIVSDYGSVTAERTGRGNNAHLTQEQRDEIVARLRRFENPTKLAVEFGVTKSYVFRLAKVPR